MATEKEVHEAYKRGRAIERAHREADGRLYQIERDYKVGRIEIGTALTAALKTGVDFAAAMLGGDTCRGTSSGMHYMSADGVCKGCGHTNRGGGPDDA